jgi:hypothetical protein
MIYNTKNYHYGYEFEPPAHVGKSVDELVHMFTHMKYDSYQLMWSSRQEPPTTYFERSKAVVSICDMAIADLKGIATEEK